MKSVDWRFLACVPALLFCAYYSYADGLAKTGLTGGAPTSVTANAPLTGAGTATSPLACSAASGSQAGCLSSADWTTFNGKQAAITVGAPAAATDSNGATLSAGTFTLEQADSTHPGIVTTGTQTVAGNKTFTGTLTVTSQTPSLKSVNCSGSPCQVFSTTSGQGLQIEGNCNSGVGAAGAILLGNQNTLNSTDVLVRFFNGSSDAVDVYSDGSIIAASGSKSRGTITLSTGTGTATVLSGAICVCTDTTANASVKCSVSSTTLTASGTGSDVIAYICL
jgi:hypothetical protein